MYKFIGRFWSEEMIKIANNEEDDTEKIYEGRESEFVSDYAATNPGEDIAESITEFILRPKKHNTT